MPPEERVLKRPQHVWVVEPDAEGHRLYYVRLLLEHDGSDRAVTAVVSRGCSKPVGTCSLGSDRKRCRGMRSSHLCHGSVDQPRSIVFPDGDRHIAAAFRLFRLKRLRVNILIMRTRTGASRSPRTR